MKSKLPENSFKRGLHQGHVLFGLWTSLSGSYATEIMAGAGADWLMLDTEHSPNELGDVLSQLQIVAAYDTSAVVRVPSNNVVAIKRFLDIGAQTLLIPQIDTADDARRAVAATRYPPNGVRGVGGTTRATRFGRVADYAERAHEELCVLVQIESQIALENIEAIAAVPGVDGLFVGPADLHASCGYVGQLRHAEVVPKMEAAIERIKAAGKPAGILSTGAADDVALWLQHGAQFIAVGSDLGILVRGAEQIIAVAKAVQ